MGCHLLPSSWQKSVTVVTISPQQLVLKERTPKVEVEEETD
jgi:hypothetical protein